MTGVVQDVAEVLFEGTEDLSNMAFDKPFKEVFDDFAMIDSKVEKADDRQSVQDKHDLLLLQSHVSQYNNPLNFLTPILIVTIIIIAILSTVCICAMGFCWYVRYNKKHERRPGNHPDSHTDPENGTNNGNKISMNNTNEESIQFINNVYKDWKRTESMRSGSRHSRRDREESEKRSERASSRGSLCEKQRVEKRTPGRGGGSSRVERKKQQGGEIELGIDSISDALQQKAKQSKDKLHFHTIQRAQKARSRANERVQRVVQRSRDSMRKRINKFLGPLSTPEYEA